MAGVTCTNLEIILVDGDESKMTCRWKCSASHIASFELNWYYKSRLSGVPWTHGGKASVQPTGASGFYVYNFTPPSAISGDWLCFSVKPVAKTHSVSYYDSNGNKKSKTEPWWTGSSVQSETFMNSRSYAINREWIRCDKAFEKAVNAADSAKAECDKKRAAKDWKAAVKADQTVQLRADETVKAADAAKAAREAQPPDAYNPTIIAKYTSAKSKYQAMKETYKGYEATDKENLSAADKKAMLDGEVANAKACLANASKHVKDAQAFRAQGRLASSADSEDKAAAEFEGAAWWFGRASGNAASEADQKAYQDSQRAASEGASQAKARATADRSRQEAAVERPSPPSARVSQSVDAAGNPALSVVMDIDCAAPYSDRIIIQRSVDGDGSWPVWKTITRKVPADGGPWNTQRIYDSEVQPGHSYRYLFRCGNGESILSDRTEMYGPFNQRPSQPRNLVAKLAGDGSVKLVWENTGAAPADSVEVQYSSWFSGENAWIANAASEIQTLSLPGNAQSATITGLEPGKTWYFRVKRTSAGGSAWATIEGGEEKGYLTVAFRLPASPAPKLAQPSALKASMASSSSVTLQWSDTLEEGASYEIEHTSNPEAWDTNAAGDISTVRYSNPGGSSNTYTVTGLEPGSIRYFRVAKRMGDAQVYAQAALHEGRHGEETVFCALPAPSASLPAPSSLAAARASDTSVMLTWSDEQLQGETYEVWYTDSASAFELNAMGDVRTATVDEMTASGAKVYTLTGLERGRTWFAKVRKKSASGAGPWSDVASCRLAGATIGKPIGLLCRQESPDSVTLRWTDAPEDGASYTVLHTTNERAFAVNAQGDVDETAVTGLDPSPVAAVCMYTATGLDKGAKHLFRLRKDKDGMSEMASAASGSTWFDGSTCFISLPAEAEPSLPLPTGVAAEARPDGSLRVTWTAQRGEGESYELQHTTDADAFAAGDMGAIASVPSASESERNHAHTISGLERGHRYYLRVRTVRDGKAGPWSQEAKVTLPPELEPTEELYAPACSDTMRAYPLGRMIPLSWTHSSAQDSEQSAYELEVAVDESDAVTIAGGASPSYAFEPVQWSVSDGTRVTWRVRTCGAVQGAWSPWSRIQEFRMFAPPVAGVSLSCDGQQVGPGEPLRSMPLHVSVRAASENGDPLDSMNAPISYALSIRALEGYDGSGRDGRPRYVAAGEEVFSASADARSDGFSELSWDLSIEAHELALEGGRAYEAVAVVVTSQGLRGEGTSGTFEAQWDGSMPQPTATFVFDGDDYCCRITPVVNVPQEEGGQDDEQVDDLTPEEREALADWGIGTLLPDPLGDLDFELVEDPSVDDSGWPLWDGCTLDVYRLDSDGTPVAVATGLANDGQSRAMDPHPSFGTCTYRIVARDDSSGLQSSCDFEVSTPVPWVVVQWDEDWEESDAYGLPTYAGSRLLLEYNQELSEGYAQDAVLREYAGRAHPVAYYGTQRGQSATMAAELVRSLDGDSLAAARRLAAWPGDCYVREPNGTGYWASAKVSISHSHGSAAVPVSLEVRRVDHGDRLV